MMLLRLHKDTDFLIEMFDAQGFEVSRPKLTSWKTRDFRHKKYREMPREALDAFIDELYKRELINESEND